MKWTRLLEKREGEVWKVRVMWEVKVFNKPCSE
jgi:hypothetical protein